MYKVTKEDLIGDIKDFPIEVVQKMVDYQVEQVGNADVSVFQRNYNAADDEKGFDWAKTQDGLVFWEKVILNEDFDLFFEKYSKKGILDTEPTKENLYTEISNEPHLLCSYEDYKKGKIGRFHKSGGLSGRTIRLLTLGYNFNKTKDEEEEYVKLQKELEIDNKNEKFTTITHEITDLYFELKNIHDDDIRHEKYELIGRKQCKIEIIKEEFKNK